MDSTSQLKHDRTRSFEWAPLRVFVVHHPDFADRKEVTCLYDWFGGPNRELHRAGFGIPVHMWTSTAPEIHPEDIPFADDELTAIIPILDSEFVGRAVWRDWLEELSSRLMGTNTILLPWAVHAKATQIATVGKSQLLGSGEIRQESFRRIATEACTLKLLQQDSLEVFISYARGDGSELVNEIMQSLREYGHVRTFCDVHDIPPGTDWEGKLRDALERGAALISVLTDKYVDRPWCREELRSFREPNCSGTHENLWWLPPAYILDHRTGEASRSILEIGSSTIAKWSHERATMIIDQLIREILFAAQSRQRAERIAKRVGVRKCVVNWIPDSWTTLSLSRLSKDGIETIVYPGDGMAQLDLTRMKHLFPGTQFISFEQSDTVDALDLEVGESSRSVVMFSISEPPVEDLQKCGFSSKHMEDFVSRLGRLALRNDFDIGYGGKPNAGFTQGIQNETGSIAIQPRMVNFLGWPYCGKLTSSEIADDLGICRYVLIESSKPCSTATEKDSVARALAATSARKAIFQDRFTDVASKSVGAIAASVFLGGQLKSYVGVLPGVIEEAMISIREGHPVYIVGSFGGAAQHLAKRFIGDSDEPLAILESENARITELRELASRELNTLVEEVRETETLNNGLSWKENIELMTTIDYGRIVHLIEKGFATIRRSPVPPSVDLERGNSAK